MRGDSFNASQFRIPEVAQQLRGLTSYQTDEKVLLSNIQSLLSFPTLVLRLPRTSALPYAPPENFIYSTYLSDAFPAAKDNLYLNYYLNLAFQNNSYRTVAWVNPSRYNLEYPLLIKHTLKKKTWMSVPS